MSSPSMGGALLVKRKASETDSGNPYKKHQGDVRSAEDPSLPTSFKRGVFHKIVDFEPVRSNDGGMADPGNFNQLKQQVLQIPALQKQLSDWKIKYQNLSNAKTRLEEDSKEGDDELRKAQDKIKELQDELAKQHAETAAAVEREKVKDKKIIIAEHQMAAMKKEINRLSRGVPSQVIPPDANHICRYKTNLDDTRNRLVLAVHHQEEAEKKLARAGYGTAFSVTQPDSPVIASARSLYHPELVQDNTASPVKPIDVTVEVLMFDPVGRDFRLCIVTKWTVDKFGTWIDFMQKAKELARYSSRRPAELAGKFVFDGNLERSQRQQQYLHWLAMAQAPISPNIKPRVTAFIWDPDHRLAEEVFTQTFRSIVRQLKPEAGISSD